MKYWRGYLVAAILAAITWALESFARSHKVLVDMIYPYISRLIMTSLADWSGGMNFNLWQVLLLVLISAGLVSIVLMILLRWNPIQWGGWVLTAVSCIFMLNTVVYGLNQYASPLADDIRLEITDYTVSELNETTLFFRDKANELASTVQRNSKNQVDIGSFEELAQIAGEGFKNLTYEEAISVFAGSTAPVKKQGWFRSKGDTGIMVPLTGEASVNPSVPNAALPFAMCKEMAHRISIYSDADAGFAAILAGMHHSDPRFQYAAYLMAYFYCYESLESIPTSTAQACAAETVKGVSQQMADDLKTCKKFFGDVVPSANLRTAEATNARTVPQETTAPTTSTDPTEETGVPEETKVTITFSSYSSITDLLASWYVQTYIAPLHAEEEITFDPLDPTHVDISGIVNAPTTP